MESGPGEERVKLHLWPDVLHGLLKLLTDQFWFKLLTGLRFGK